MNNHEGIGAAFNKMREDITRSLRTDNIPGENKEDKKDLNNYYFTPMRESYL